LLVYIYLSDAERSLDQIEKDLGLSKAAVSIAARQLEGLGLVRRVWKTGDRKNYYRTVKHFGSALQSGVLGVVRNKLSSVGSELDHAEQMLSEVRDGKKDPDVKLVQDRLRLARRHRDRIEKILQSPILKLLGKR
jgi:DNA-binding transcriptional regulator GbsR (MarR family)